MAITGIKAFSVMFYHLFYIDFYRKYFLMPSSKIFNPIQSVVMFRFKSVIFLVYKFKQSNTVSKSDSCYFLKKFPYLLS